MSDIIAEHKLYFYGMNEPKVVVRFFRPQEKPATESQSIHFVCRYQIENVESGELLDRYGVGLHALGALLSALAIVGTEIEVINGQLSGKLREDPSLRDRCLENCGLPFYDPNQKRTLFPKAS